MESYSQEGEDLILSRYFGKKHVGFYVDVGAHHPFRYSNTYLFYKRGWRGINIDATPGSMLAFNRYRPRDVNIECGVSEDEGLLELSIFNESALNSFDRDLVVSRKKKHKQFSVQEKAMVQVKPLRDILESVSSVINVIDFMNIDVEGMDLSVLRSNDWSRYRPKVILVEILDTDLDEFFYTNEFAFIDSIGYKLFAKTFNTFLFSDNEFSKRK